MTADPLSDHSACEPGTCWAESLGDATDHWKREAEKARDELADQRRRLEPDGAGGFRWEAADLEAERDRLRAENEALKAEVEKLRRAAGTWPATPCGCSTTCGDDGDIDGPGTCKGLPMKREALVEFGLVRRDHLRGAFDDSQAPEEGR